jgi:hypothetical protein
MDLNVRINQAHNGFDVTACGRADQLLAHGNERRIAEPFIDQRRGRGQ